MPRLDHAAFEAPDPDRTARFYERVLGARVVETEGHPVKAYVGTAAITYARGDDPRRA
jgi:catechol 2,3-dioxygenase-like lactoylglutathione lyase family enzyme